MIHQKNQGVSVARNAGLDACRGEYITFIDSDDYYSDPETLRSNVALMKEKPSVDIVQFPFIDGESNVRRGTSHILEVNRENIFEQLFVGEVTGMPWAKIYRASSLHNIYFNSNILYFEDIHFLHDLFPRIKNLLVSNMGAYYYRYRGKSRMHETFSLQKLKDMLRFRTRNFLVSLKETPHLHHYQIETIYIIFSAYMLHPACKKFYDEQHYDLWRYIPGFFPKMLNFGFGRKLLLFYTLYRCLGYTVAHILIKTLYRIFGVKE